MALVNQNTQFNYTSVTQSLNQRNQNLLHWIQIKNFFLQVKTQKLKYLKMVKFLENFTPQNYSAVNNFDNFIINMAEIVKFFAIDLWIGKGKFQKFVSKVSLLLIALSMCGLYFEAIHSSFCIFDDASAALTTIFIACEIEIVIVKLLTTRLKKNKISELFDLVRNDFWRFNDNECIKKKLIIQGSRKMKIIIKLYLSIFILVVIVSEVRPIIHVIMGSKSMSPLLIYMPGKNI